MQMQTRIASIRLSRKTGIATLELVMCMPVLLLLMVGIVWLGFSVVGQSQVAVEARHKAWQRRFDEGSAAALNFVGNSDFATEEATTAVNVSPLLDDVSPPQSSHDVAMGTWDHNQVDLNAFPNWELYLVAVANAKTAGVQTAYVDGRNLLNQIQTMAGQLVLEQIKNLIKQMLESPLGMFKGDAQAGKQQQEDEANEKKQAIRATISNIEDELETVEKRIEELQELLEEAEDEDEKESLESRLKVSKNKLKRLEAELKRLKADLKEG